MLSNELEYCLNGAFHQARESRHEYLTVEHLLLAILDTPKVREVLRACGADLAKLKQELQEHIDQSTPRLEETEEREVQPTLGFQRVLQRAVFHVQSSGKKEVGVGNVLVAIFSEKQSHAVFLLNRQHVSRLGALDPDRPRLRIAVRNLGLVAPVVVRANLPRKRVLGFEQNRLARLHAEPRRVVPTEFVVKRSDGETLHRESLFTLAGGDVDRRFAARRARQDENLAVPHAS